MAKYVSHPISILDQYQPSGIRPAGWYWSLGLIWGVIQILPCIILYTFKFGFVATNVFVDAWKFFMHRLVLCIYIFFNWGQYFVLIESEL